MSVALPIISAVLGAAAVRETVVSRQQAQRAVESAKDRNRRIVLQARGVRRREERVARAIATRDVAGARLRRRRAATGGRAGDIRTTPQGLLAGGQAQGGKVALGL